LEEVQTKGKNVYEFINDEGSGEGICQKGSGANLIVWRMTYFKASYCPFP
jgi:hypothetical protein